jgi:hypothetical protein
MKKIENKEFVYIIQSQIEDWYKYNLHLN